MKIRGPKAELRTRANWTLKTEYLSRRQSLEKPLDRRREDVGAGFIVELDGDGEQRAAFGSEVRRELCEGLRRRTSGGGDGAIRRLPKFGIKPTDDGKQPVHDPEVAEEKFTAGGLGEREQGAGVDGAEVIEIFGIGRQAQELPRLGGGLEAEEAVEGEGEDGHGNFGFKIWTARSMLWRSVAPVADVVPGDVVAEACGLVALFVFEEEPSGSGQSCLGFVVFGREFWDVALVIELGVE
jgi:hypothetical protein